MTVCRYQECFDLYREVLKNTSDDFETERLTNLAAVAVHLGKSAKLADSEETYELCYNKACRLLTQGKWLEAELALKRSVEMCTKFLAEEEEEEASQEDIDRETGIILVQLGFAYQMQGREREAQAVYNQVSKICSVSA